MVSLGSSLRKFTRLKQLDLSRNNISSLQGLESLKLLEKLNLYYNNIENLEDLKRLKHNPNLKELDLRLNPVTRTEADYRLYLIHMLPNLQKLDDRSVRDRERQGALIHFSSSQATEMTHHPPRKEPQERPPNPRAEHVKTMGSGKVLDDDDVELLDLIARTGGDLRHSRPLTGSSAKDPATQDYSLAGLKQLEPLSLDGPQIEIPHKKKPPSEIDDVMAAYKQKYPNIPDVLVTNGDTGGKRQDPNLEFADEAEAYHKFKSHGYFTPHPTAGEPADQSSHSFVQIEREAYPPPPSRVQLERTRGPADPNEDLDTGTGHRRSYSMPSERLEHEYNPDELNRQPQMEKYTEAESRAADLEEKALRRTEERAPPCPSRPVPAETSQSKLFLFQFLDLVDRYWNGSKSLHKNVKFKGMAYGLVDDYLRKMTDESQQLEMRRLKEDVTLLQKENDRIRRQEDMAKSSLEDSAATEAHLKASLQKAFTDIELLKDNIQTFSNENKRLQFKLQQVEAYSSHSAAAGSASASANQTSLEDLQRQNDLLHREVEKQQIKLKQFSQLQELSAMLQESHKSLVQTNDHLLKELDETRSRHQHEVKQLNWSYEQLKKTLGPEPSTIPRDSSAFATLYDSDT